MTDCRRQCGWCAEKREKGFRGKKRRPGRERRGDGKMKREVGWMNVVLTVVLLGSAGVVRAQETQDVPAPPPPEVMAQGGMVGGEPGTTVMIQAGALGEAGTFTAGEAGAFFENHIELLGF